ncbi:hypothetical protein BDZ90DRAFT_281897 [Jaminaea rosea]|uniref:Uncharacterized protein n=1 Tax=Jaminaea rosea TaxID=1569628 RepID=A0A316UI68_9BASI|nr:hypothetical protein BDZ90DRAFT_281897 [Jaminaea rosea]PWN24910.1 hypothetical protein BDZ90DRAFT_281897 [Jaminaea rosea]
MLCHKSVFAIICALLIASGFAQAKSSPERADLSTRFVHSTLPSDCAGGTVYCLTAQKGFDASPALSNLGCTVARSIDHDNDNWVSYLINGPCSGTVELLCPLGNNEPANHRARMSFTFGPTSSLSTSDQYLIGVTSDGKRLQVAPSRSGTVSTKVTGADLQAWCKFWP